MLQQKQETENWLSSKDAQKALKVPSCELMHLQVVGKLPYKKQGNAYFYLIPKQPKEVTTVQSFDALYAQLLNWHQSKHQFVGNNMPSF